jgi:hypothetical protein
MHLRIDHEWRPFFRGAVVGLLVAASTFTADLAAFAGHLDLLRFVLFGIAALLAACLAISSIIIKKMLPPM